MNERLSLITALNAQLLADMPAYRELAEGFPEDEASQRRLLRSLMNLRPPMPLSDAFLTQQDALLKAETAEKGVVLPQALLPAAIDPRLFLWRGDITRLKVDGIVNAANEALLGCFCPCHGCIDNAIHSAAGLQLRDECHRLMAAQGHPEPVGRAKLTKAYNLPSRFVLHTVGPTVHGGVTPQDRNALADCYRACLKLAADNGLHSLAFCCVSTGEYHFPNELAAQIAVQTTRRFLENSAASIKVIFNVFKPEDETLYQRLLGENSAP